MTDPHRPLVLAADTVITPVEDLPDEVRARFELLSGSFAVTRLHSRVPTKVLDSEGTGLLREFAQPKRLVEAVLSFSLARGLNPQATLRAAFALLGDLVRSELLVEPDSAGAVPVKPSLEAGAAWSGHQVDRCVRVMTDTEVYRLSGPADDAAALKIVRRGAPPAARLEIARECATLCHLGGSVAPRLLQDGSTEGTPYVLMEWIAGVDAETAALHWREGGGETGLLDMCERILRAYATLHAAGVVHGDIHPTNVMVRPSGSVVILDYGVSVLKTTGRRLRVARAGRAEYFEPEYARAALEGRRVPEASAASDQYSLAVLLYQCLTGQACLNFSPTWRRALEQTVAEAPLSFAVHGEFRWPAIERVLLRALSKTAKRRFPDVAAFADAFSGARPRAAPPSPRREGSAAGQFLKLHLRQLAPEGQLLTRAAASAPAASVYYGLAGTALALLHMASVRGDPLLFAHARLWAERCRDLRHRRTAFLSPRLGLTEALVGRVSPFHAGPGPGYLGAVIADTLGDNASRDRALVAWLRVLGLPSGEVELTLGWAGVLLALGFALELVGEENPSLRRRLLAAGGKVTARISRQVARARSGSPQNLGIAHGTGGVLYATLRWTMVSGEPYPAWMEKRLEEIARRAKISSAGARWPWFTLDSRGRAATSYMPGWCNGSAGLIWLWTLAARATGEERYGRLAELAALDAWKNDPGEIHFCCGLVGIAYGMLNLYRHTGDKLWAERAQTLAERAAERAIESARSNPAEFAHSLFRGEAGLATLIVDLERPALAGFPLFDAAR